MPPLAAAAPAGPRLTRRALLASSAGGLALLAGGCTSSRPSAERTPESTRGAEALAGQLPVQEAVVAAYKAALGADPGLAGQVSDLAPQAGLQLDRLRAAAPTASASPPAASSPAAPVGPSSARDARTWLRTQLAAAADSHAAACVQQTGARAALLGSIAAGLRGQERRVASGAGGG